LTRRGCKTFSARSASENNKAGAGLGDLNLDQPEIIRGGLAARAGGEQVLPFYAVPALALYLGAACVARGLRSREP
jgi:hypothetical protein